MQNLGRLILSILLCCCCSAEEETQTLFLGEDFHIAMPVGKVDVSFRPSIGRGPEKALMTAGDVVDTRAKLNTAVSHLILENVGESDEGVYVITSDTENVTHVTLFVRDCSNEVIVKYGSDFHVVLSDISEPLQVGFRHSAVEANQTSLPAVELLNDDGTATENYQDRISVTPQKFTLYAVTDADKGSYTLTDSNGKVKKKICLNVKAHLIFVHLTYGDTLKIDLHLNSSSARLLYSSESDKIQHVILERGKLVLPPNLDFEDRFSLEESVCILTGLKASDTGVFSETDLQGFLVSEVYLKVEAYTLPKLYIAIIALVALLVLLLLVCLVTCLVRICKRGAKARDIEEKGKNADKVEGDALRQVVKDACTNQDEEAPALSQKEDITEKSQSTEVSIRGLEVSTKEPSLQERNLETSDSGVGFNTTGLPLDSDTDVATIADSDVSAATDVKTIANQVSEPKTAPSPPKQSPTPDLKPAPVTTAPPPPSPEPKPVTPESKPAVTPTPEPKLSLSPTPDTKATLSPSPEPKQLVTPEATKPTADVKPLPSPTPEPPKALTPTPDAKPATTPDAKPAVSPVPETTPAKIGTPEQKTAVSPTPDPKPVTITATPEPKPALTPDPKPVSPTPDLKPTSPTPQSKSPVSPILDTKPITNGTPESKADIEPSAPVSPGLDVKGVETPATPPKTPDTGKGSLKTPELISSEGLSPEGKLDMASAGDSAPSPSNDGTSTN